MLDLPPVEHFAEQIRKRATSDDEPTILALAQIERLMAYYSAQLDESPGDSVAAKWFKDLNGEARHLRSELGIGKQRKDGGSEPLPSARRGT